MHSGVVVLVMANYGYRKMLANWMCDANRVGIKYFLRALYGALK